MSLDQSIADAFHEWYAANLAHAITYRGVPIMKCVFDLWNYQEIIFDLKPNIVIEFGTAMGGSALWFADVLDCVNPAATVITVDIDDSFQVPIWATPKVRKLTVDSTSPALGHALNGLLGPKFAILDSDHSKAHVLAEMELLRPVLQRGDYLVVEDGNINGHPIYVGWGEGPYEAIEEYERRYPGDYEHDYAMERRFGFTFAVNGYLRRR